MNGSDLVPVVLCGLAAVGLLLGSLHLRRKQRLLHDLPTSKVRGVFIGLVEIAGTAESTAPLTAFLSSTACVHFDYEVEEHWSRVVTETSTDKNGKSHTRTRHESGWKTVAHGGEMQDFYLRDDTGIVLIRPDHAKLEPQTLFEQTVTRDHPLYYAKAPDSAVANSDHRRRFVERGIALHAPLYVVGQARERTDVVAPEIAHDPAAPVFIISTSTEKAVQSRLAIGSWVCWALGLVAAAGTALFVMSHLPPHSFGPLVLALAGYFGLWALGWTWMVFNALIALRNRVRQGWSLIEVQLKRRHDLIPGLAAAIAGLSTHEQSTQTALAALRGQSQATPPGVAGPDFAGVAGTLRAVVESYPQLVAQESFAQLHRQLVETEQRIALARTYYNNIATQFATRLERLPDGWVARLAAMKPEPLLAAANFERASVEVNFTPPR